MINLFFKSKSVSFFFLFTFFIFNKVIIVYGNDNFENAVRKALEKSLILKSASHLIESKKKLIQNSYSDKNWDTSFSSTFSITEKKFDHQGSYTDENLNNNNITLKRNIYDSNYTKNKVEISKLNFRIEKNNYKIKKQDLLLQIVKGYLDLYKYDKILIHRY